MSDDDDDKGESAVVFDIQKFSVHDGPGIRTTVFLKGCPLRCRWCHNPESWSLRPEILFSADKCAGCGACVAACPEGCHTMRGDDGDGDGGAVAHGFDRGRCTGCGLCAKACFGGALELCGKRRTVAQVLAEVLKDKPFYENSGGGMTISGGEPMFQFAFTRNLAEAAKGEGLHVCIETCGFAPPERYSSLRPFIDLFLYDIKSVDAAKHRELTGQDNVLILSNLRALDAAGARLRLRCPLVPGLNDSPEELRGIGELADSLAHVELIEIEPYHPLGTSKAERLGLANPFAHPFVEKSGSEKWKAEIARHTSIPVTIS